MNVPIVSERERERKSAGFSILRRLSAAKDFPRDQSSSVELDFHNESAVSRTSLSVPTAVFLRASILLIVTLEKEFHRATNDELLERKESDLLLSRLFFFETVRFPISSAVAADPHNYSFFFEIEQRHNTINIDK